MTNQLSTQIQDGYSQLVKLAGQDDVKARFADALGKNSGAFLASLVNTVGTTPALRECTPDSILRAAMTAAVLNLPVDKNLGQAWIIPYRNQGKREAQFQMGYKGFVQLCLRTGQYTHLNAANIYEGMGIEENVLTGEISVTGRKMTDKVIGYAAYLRLKNGFEKTVYWSYEKVHEHARRYSKSYTSGKDDTPWKTHPDDMGKKTVLIQLVRRWGIMSVQVQEAIKNEERADVVIQKIANDYLEGEYYEPEPPQEPSLVVNGEQPHAFDPVACLVENHISENEHAARGLLKKIPNAIKASPEELIPVGKLYRAWKDSGVTTDQAVEYALDGVAFEQ